LKGVIGWQSPDTIGTLIEAPRSCAITAKGRRGKIISLKRRLRSRRRLPGMAAPQRTLAARAEAARNRRGARSRAVITAKSQQSRFGERGSGGAGERETREFPRVS